MPLPAVLVAIGRGLAGLATSAAQAAATAGATAATTAAATIPGATAATTAQAAAAAGNPVANAAAQAAMAAVAGSGRPANPAAQGPAAIGQSPTAQAAAQVASGAGRSPGPSPSGPFGPSMGGLPNIFGPGGGSQPSFGGLMSSVVGNISPGQALRGAMGNPIEITKMLIEVAKLPARLRDFGAALVDSQSRLAQYSGSIAASVGRLRGDRFRRELQLAGATSGSFGQLSRSQSALEDKLMPYRIGATNLLNGITSSLQRLLTTAIDVLEKVSSLDDWFKSVFVGEIKKDEGNALSRLVKELAREKGPARRFPPIDLKKGK